MAMNKYSPSFIQLSLNEVDGWQKMPKNVCIFRVIEKNLMPNKGLAKETMFFLSLSSVKEVITLTYLFDCKSSPHGRKYAENAVVSQVINIESTRKIPYP